MDMFATIKDGFVEFYTNPSVATRVGGHMVGRIDLNEKDYTKTVMSMAALFAQDPDVVENGFMCSSSVDFPSEYGVTAAIDVRSLMDTALETAVDL